MTKQKLTTQKTLSPSKEIFHMSVTRTSCIASNMQITLMIIAILFGFASFLYPILSMLNYLFAFCIIFIIIVGTIGIILLGVPLEDLFDTFIIFPFDASEKIFAIIDNALPIVSGILIGLSVITLLTQIFFNKERASFRIVFAVLGIIGGILGFVLNIIKI